MFLLLSEKGSNEQGDTRTMVNNRIKSRKRRRPKNCLLKVFFLTEMTDQILVCIVAQCVPKLSVNSAIYIGT